ncbi:tetratricopeptide repeat protein [Desulfobacula phenolica]|uniref:Tetratricopeptide repeat-containing protein n=1 Tax=Desulfobacula phenolica TaxID=90732 RepID=A0A1H2J1C2_9BACT|nr:tetratricopeptide repeat protein [Desulfobacula phenolica]SDU49868.1 Tetratricopeptide repeat-containing protein [Desulfobacula phenolica]
MSLIQDYLDKTSPGTEKIQGSQVPPMLCREKKEKTRARRYLPLVLVFCAVLSVSGYSLKRSGQNLVAAPAPAQVPQKIQDDLNEKKTGQITSFSRKDDETPLIIIEQKQNSPAPHTNEQVSQEQFVQEQRDDRELKQLRRESIQEQTAQKQPILKQPVHRSVQQPVHNPVQQPVTVMEPVVMEPAVMKPAVRQQKPAGQALLAKAQSRPDTAPDTAIAKPEKSSVSRQAQFFAPKKAAPVKNNVSGRIDPEDYFNLGQSAQKADNLNLAMDFYRKALLLDPNYTRALLNLSAIHIKRGNTKRATAILEKLHAREPGNPDVMLNLGILHIRQKEYDKAKTLIEKNLEIRGDNPKALFNLAYLNQVQNRLEPALNLYKRSSVLDPDNTKAILAAASILEQQKKFSDALKYYAKALNTGMARQSEAFKLKIQTRINLLQRIQINIDQRMESKS